MRPAEATEENSEAAEEDSEATEEETEATEKSLWRSTVRLEKRTEVSKWNNANAGKEECVTETDGGKEECVAG